MIWYGYITIVHVTQYIHTWVHELGHLTLFIYISFNWYQRWKCKLTGRGQLLQVPAKICHRCRHRFVSSILIVTDAGKGLSRRFWLSKVPAKVCLVNFDCHRCRQRFVSSILIAKGAGKGLSRRFWLSQMPVKVCLVDFDCHRCRQRFVSSILNVTGSGKGLSRPFCWKKTPISAQN